MMFGKKKKYNILVLGCNGMLGHELYENLRSCSILKSSNVGIVLGLDKEDIDLTHRHVLGNFFMNSIHFDYCINCAAYTDTKAAETTKAGRELDYKLNALVPKYIAESCNYWKTKLIHISTDYVFSEKSIDALRRDSADYIPFMTYDEPFPCNIYGYDKLLGEKFIETVYGKNTNDYAICRVSWLYGMHNSKSFIHKFLKNIATKIKENQAEKLTMTSNEISVPTSVNYVIECIKDIIDNGKSGIFHAVPTIEDNGVSRFEFANAILECFKTDENNTQYSINGKVVSDINLIPVEYDGYQPKFSALKNLNSYDLYNTAIGPNISWKDDLSSFMKKHKDQLFEYMQKYMI